MPRKKRKIYPGSLTRRGGQDHDGLYAWFWRWQFRGQSHRRTFKAPTESEAHHQLRKAVEQIQERLAELAFKGLQLSARPDRAQPPATTASH